MGKISKPTSMRRKFAAAKETGTVATRRQVKNKEKKSQQL